MNVTARDFRQNIKTMLDKVSSGEEVVINRNNEYFLVVQVNMKPDITPELEAKLQVARDAYNRGEYTHMTSHEDIDAYLNSL
ncbi:MAG: type II toxin-antitoxin system Phd/YefM family antitoxin [Prevotellaceae bacterium]|nr:type II toxin-antitoxin system Phd/YefM family antitoxin [Candidatus Minthosoma equi]